MLEEGGSIITFYTGKDARKDNEKIKADCKPNSKMLKSSFMTAVNLFITIFFLLKNNYFLKVFYH
jgi:hypothetical protein